MNKRTRLILLLICVVCFLVIAPYITLYSLGYRVDFLHMKITATGGIYIKASPLPLEVSIDSKSQKTSFLTNSVFAQNLLPKSHTVSIKKDGYYDYQKNLEVKENQVTKLERVLLFKKDILFDNLIDNIDYFSVSPDARKIIFKTGSKLNIFDSQDKSQKIFFELPSAAAVQDLKWSDNSQMILLKTTSSGAIKYFLLDTSKTLGVPPESDLQPLSYLSKNSQQIYFNPQDPQELFFLENKKIYSAKEDKASIIISNVISYKISNNSIVWLSSEGFLLRSSLSGKLIEKIIPEEFKPPIDDYEFLISNDGQKIICFNGNKIYIYSFKKPEEEYGLLYGPSEKISNVFWLNNDYLIFNAGNKIIISEIDFRGGVNAITLQIESPKISFNQKDNKLYVLKEKSLLSSEKLTP